MGVRESQLKRICCDGWQTRGFPCGSGKGRRGQASPGQRPGSHVGLRRLVFPQGKEEICKEEVVESPVQQPGADRLTYKRRAEGTLGV